MKKVILLSLFALVFGINSQAQAVGRFNVITEPYFGFPNLMKIAFETSYINNASPTSGITNVDFGGFNPSGIRAEFMLSDKFGIGTDTWYSAVNFSFDYTSEFDNKVYTQTASFNRLNSLLAFNIHFGDSDKLDVYSSLCVGYALRTFKAETTDPNDLSTITRESAIPIGFRLGFGMRYFPIPQVGVAAALGIGGALISTGIVTKF